MKKRIVLVLTLASVAALAFTACGSTVDTSSIDNAIDTADSAVESAADTIADATDKVASDGTADAATTDSTETTADTTTETTESDSSNDSTDISSITSGMDVATANATLAAANYLSMKGFSRQGLIDQLSSEYGDQYTVDQATAAVSAIETAGLVNWTEEATRAGEDYLSMKGFSKQGLIDQLSSEYGDQFTVDEATAGVQAIEDAGKVDWNEEAVKSAQDYLDMTSFSRQGLIDQLSSEYGDKFTAEQATYAADQVGL